MGLEEGEVVTLTRRSVVREVILRLIVEHARSDKQCAQNAPRHVGRIRIEIQSGCKYGLLRCPLLIFILWRHRHGVACKDRTIRTHMIMDNLLMPL